METYSKSGIRGPPASLYDPDHPATISSTFNLASGSDENLCVYVDDNIVATVRHADFSRDGGSRVL